MTWRERIAEARARGGFTEEDKRLARSPAACAIGETMAPFGKYLHNPFLGWWCEAGMTVPTDRPSGVFTAAVYNNDFSRAETCLDAIEDFVLRLKREGKIG